MKVTTRQRSRPKAGPERAASRPEPSGDPSNNHNGKRPRILAAALRLFARHPYQAVTMDRVSHEAGVAKGTLYLYFPSKEALYLGILTDGLESITLRYQSSVEPGADVAERLRRAIDVSIQFYGDRRDFLRLLATEEPRIAAARNRLLEGWRERGYAFFSALIDEGVRQGVFTPTDSRMATLAMLGGMRSVLLYYGTQRPVSEIGRDFGDFVLRGLSASSALGRATEARP